jgi:hypothetical protein
MRTRYLWIIVLLGIIGTPPYAYACLYQKTLTEEQASEADLVFTGNAVDYAPANKGSPAVVTFHVEKIILGNAPSDTLQVYWVNGMFGESLSLKEFRTKYGYKNKVGVIFPETYNSHRKCEKKPGVNGLGEKVETIYCTIDLPLPFYPKEDATFYDKPWIISDVCSTAFISPAD